MLSAGRNAYAPRQNLYVLLSVSHTQSTCHAATRAASLPLSTGIHFTISIFTSTCHHPAPHRACFSNTVMHSAIDWSSAVLLDLPQLLVSPPGGDTVTALPAPEIPPFPGAPDQMSSLGL